ncbi:HNH endonuclease [Mycoplasma todarodis]|uniref:HNH endonuclease n=1 Tax=Mycoplasma todarodis TaxID=1937191 RepID=UPI003B311B87
MSGNRYGDYNIEGKVWDEYFGIVNEAQDAFGHRIIWTHYNRTTQFGWTLDHIWPKNPRKAKRKGSDNYKNLQPLCIDCNNEKANEMSGTIDGQFFSITAASQKTSDNGEVKMIGRMDVDGERETIY